MRIDGKEYRTIWFENKIVKITENLDLKERTFDVFLNWIMNLREEFNIPHKLSNGFVTI